MNAGTTSTTALLMQTASIQWVHIPSCVVVDTLEMTVQVSGSAIVLMQPLHFWHADINECEFNNGNCSHYCTDTIGSFTCHCPEGFDLLAPENLLCTGQY